MDRRPSRFVKAVYVIAATCWIAGVTAVVVRILAYIVPDPSSHEAGDATLALIIWSPFVVVGLIGIVAMAGVVRRWRRARALAIGWGVLALGLGLVASAKPLTVAVLLLTGAGVQFTSGTDWIATYPQDGATYFVYQQDLLPLWFAIWGAVALAGAIWPSRVIESTTAPAAAQP